jgi:uncharacterized protein (TIGR04255 family)
MSAKMKSAPVFFTVGQVQHNPLLNLGSYLPVIQERMRKAGYPDFRRMKQVQFDLVTTVGGDGSPLPSPTVQEVERFVFSDTSSTRAFVLQPSALSFQTTEYDTFEPFLAQLKLGLDILGEAVGGLAFVERLGLRYLDAVVPAHGDALSKYLARELLGVPASIQDRMPGAKFAYSFAEATLLAEGVGQVVARTIIQNGQLVFPVDLRPDPLKVPERFQTWSGEHAVLDSDGSFSERQEFDVAAVESRLRQLHDLIDKVFHATVTDYARKTWGAGDKQ